MFGLCDYVGQWGYVSYYRKNGGRHEFNRGNDKRRLGVNSPRANSIVVNSPRANCPYTNGPRTNSPHTKTRGLNCVSKNHKENESRNLLISSMMNNSLYSIDIFHNKLGNQSTNVAKNNEFESANGQKENYLNRVNTLASISQSPNDIKRPITPSSVKTNILIPSDLLLQSKICEVLNINEDLLTNHEMKLSVESRKASKRSKISSHKYYKEITYLKDDLRQKGKESLLEYLNLNLKKGMSGRSTIL
jgi:hypothetical protein